jgi:hypothetical protein
MSALPPAASRLSASAVAGVRRDAAARVAPVPVAPARVTPMQARSPWSQEESLPPVAASALPVQERMPGFAPTAAAGAVPVWAGAVASSAPHLELESSIADRLLTAAWPSEAQRSRAATAAALASLAGRWPRAVARQLAARRLVLAMPAPVAVDRSAARVPEPVPVGPRCVRQLVRPIRHGQTRS